MMTPWYRALFPRTILSPTRQSAHDFETTLGGGRLALSRGGPITGRGAHFIILDDPIKADEALSDLARQSANNFVASTLITRRNNPRTVAYIVAMQRLHEDDTSGWLLRAGGWRHVCLPAIAQEDEVWTYQTPFAAKVVRRAAGEVLHDEREPRPELDKVRQTQGDYFFTAQYLQRPVPMAGNLVPIEKFGRYEPTELPSTFDEVVLSLDTAFKDKELSDYSVITHWGRKANRVYLVCVYRMKATYSDLKVKLGALFSDVRPHRVLIEDCASGQSLIQELKSEGVYEVAACTPKGDKAVRMLQAAILIEAGEVFIPADAPWLAVYLHELAAFPAGRYDDQVNSTSQALNWFRERKHKNGWIEYAKQRYESRRERPTAPPHLEAPWRRDSQLLDRWD